MFDTYAEIFAQRAADYHYAMTTSPRARDAEFNAVLDPIRDRPQGLVCDMPSGGGYLAEYLPEALDYIAIDPATDFFVEWPRPLQRLLAEITNVPLADQSVDFVVSLAGLHHEPSLAKVFAEMRRLLRPGGRLVIIDLAPHGLEYLRDEHAHVRLGFSHQAMSEWVRKAGLDVEQVVDLHPGHESGQGLTVTVWLARDPRRLMASAASEGAEPILAGR